MVHDPRIQAALREVLPLRVYSYLRRSYWDFIVPLKRRRRVELGSGLTIVFENQETVLFQLHEVLLAGGIQGEAGVRQEIEEYAPLIPRRGELTATVLIDGGCPVRGRRLGRRLAHGSHAISLRAGSRLVGGEPIDGTADPSSPVHYLTFPIGGLAATLDREEATLLLDDEDAQVAVSLPSEVRHELSCDARRERHHSFLSELARR